MSPADAAARFRIAVKQGLRDGLGVEDIAIKLDRQTATVRVVVEEMRQNGELTRLYRNVRESERRRNR